MSAVAPKADIGRREWNVRQVPLGDIVLIRLPSSSKGGTMTPSASARIGFILIRSITRWITLGETHQL